MSVSVFFFWHLMSQDQTRNEGFWDENIHQEKGFHGYGHSVIQCQWNRSFVLASTCNWTLPRQSKKTLCEDTFHNTENKKSASQMAHLISSWKGRRFVTPEKVSLQGCLTIIQSSVQLLQDTTVKTAWCNLPSSALSMLWCRLILSTSKEHCVAMETTFSLAIPWSSSKLLCVRASPERR